MMMDPPCDAAFEIRINQWFPTFFDVRDTFSKLEDTRATFS
jgi:hypothetical protein